MSQGSDASEKTEKPTPFKLREAKKKGAVAKSQELNALLIMSSVLLLVVAIGESVADRAFYLCRQLFLDVQSLVFEETHLIAWFTDRFVLAFEVISPLLAVVVLVSVAGTLVQTGPIFSFHSIKPDLKKINPATGFKRLFSIRTLYEAGKTSIKLLLFSVVVYWTLSDAVTELAKLVLIHPGAYISFFIGQGVTLASRMLAVLALIALADFVFSRREFIKNLMMSKKEIKDEHKRQEGDPLIKSKRKEFQKSIKDNAKSIAGVKDADVVITNPTHIAMALKYNKETMLAPMVCGRGAGDVAGKMRGEARKHGVYIVENKPLARMLFKVCRVGSNLPDKYFVEVAALYRQVYAIRQKIKV